MSLENAHINVIMKHAATQIKATSAVAAILAVLVAWTATQHDTAPTLRSVHRVDCSAHTTGCQLERLAAPALLVFPNDAQRRLAIALAWSDLRMRRAIGSEILSWSTKRCVAGDARCRARPSLFLNVNAELARQADLNIRLHARSSQTFEQFWTEAATSRGEGVWRYAAIELDRSLPSDADLAAAIDTAAPPNASLTFRGSTTPEWAERSMLWLSTAGVEAQLHYDELHNVFVQLRGHKEMLLLPPNASAHVRLFPRQHPFQRQARVTAPRVGGRLTRVACNGAGAEAEAGAGVSISVGDAEKGCGAAALVSSGEYGGWETEGRRVVLSPGDTLYVPPFWYHAVLSLDASASVSFVGDAAETATTLASRELRHCTDAGWALEKKALALRLHLIALLGRPRLVELYAQRYYLRGAEDAPTPAPRWARACAAYAAGDLDAPPLLSAAERARGRNIARARRALFDTISDRDVREQIEMNEAELMLSQELGYSRVATWLRVCV